MMNTAKQKGAVYCVTNPTMQDLVKIGIVESDDAGAVKRRIDNLYNTSIPVPFELHYAVAVDDPSAIEKMLHDAFQPYRENERREFFRIDPEQAVAAMQLTGGERITITDAPGGDDAEVTQTDINARERAQAREIKRFSKFKFSMVDIPPGETLTYFYDSSITAVVHDDKNKIRFEGKETTTSAAAKIILERQGGGDRSVAGPRYWKYDGETLNERRMRMEEAEAESDE